MNMDHHLEARKFRISESRDTSLISLLSKESTGGGKITIVAAMTGLKENIDAYLSQQMSDKFTQSVVFAYDKDTLTLFMSEFQRTFELVQQGIGANGLPENQQTLNCVLPSQEYGQETSSLEGVKPVPKIEKKDFCVAVMRGFRLDTFDMIITDEASGKNMFLVPYHYHGRASVIEEQVHDSRTRRLAQETGTLANSLPISFNSSIFVRCDTVKLHLMKVLITGPDDTPYAGGCEFDVFFPNNYPQSPMLVNLATAGAGTVRFNPKLCNKGGVCLSTLNTWSGGQGENWNKKKSTSFQII